MSHGSPRAGRYGFAQSLFQVGGNVGSALGPLLAALIVVPFGQGSLSWFSVIALLGMILLFNVGRWYRNRLPLPPPVAKRAVVGGVELAAGHVTGALLVLALLVFSKFLYVSSLTTFYTFYVMERFGVDVQASQLLLFVFLVASAAGTFIGGPVGDRFGRKVVIWGSILGALPFTLMLPYANLFWTIVLTVIIGVVISSAFSAIVVMGHALLPSRIGMVSGLFFGFAFGMSGIGAAALGILADHTSIEFVFTGVLVSPGDRTGHGLPARYRCEPAAEAGVTPQAGGIDRTNRNRCLLKRETAAASPRPPQMSDRSGLLRRGDLGRRHRAVRTLVIGDRHLLADLQRGRIDRGRKGEGLSAIEGHRASGRIDASNRSGGLRRKRSESGTHEHRSRTGRDHQLTHLHTSWLGAAPAQARRVTPKPNGQRQSAVMVPRKCRRHPSEIPGANAFDLSAQLVIALLAPVWSRFRYQSNTRRARSVFQRLALPISVSMSKLTRSG